MKKIIFSVFGVILVLFFVVGAQSTVSAKNDDIKLKVFVHYPKPQGKPVTSLSCTTTGDDRVNDFLLAGWQMPSSGMTYKINYQTKPKNLSSEQIDTAISSGFATWTEADSNQIFIDDDTTTVKAAKYDRTNAILWKGIRGSAIAITYLWYNSRTGLLVEADTVFNKNLKWSSTPSSAGDCGGVAGTFDVQNIATHEFGHWVGLDDLYTDIDQDLTMYGYGDTAELKKDSLGRGDITGVNSVAP